MQIKTTLRLHLTQSEWLPSIAQTPANAAEDVGKRSTVSGNVNCCNHYGKALWRLLKKLKIELPPDPVTPFPDLYLKKCATG
jgi:hypothetical protein